MEQVNDDTLTAARKVIAVHINYPSRAAQRGRTPAQPSYFLKPSSSLSLTGTAVERPSGCEFLGYEGEIANHRQGSPPRRRRRCLGPRRRGHGQQRPRRVRPPLCEQGLQPPVEGRRRLHPGRPGTDPGRRRRPRPTADPHLAQRRPGAGRHHPRPAVPVRPARGGPVQLLTLEEGDIILTGTPAGASVAVPGDVLEVEVGTDGRAEHRPPHHYSYGRHDGVR